MKELEKGVWLPIHSGYNPEEFLGSWLSPCHRFVIQQEDGYYKLIADKIDYVKYINTSNQYDELEGAIEYCERIININNL
jgi:hypothetical protein